MNYEDILSNRVKSIQPSGIRRFFDLASEVEGVISLGVGEPDFATPWHICDAAIYSIENEKTHYTANQGLLELRQEICNYHKNRFHMEYDPHDEVIVTVGGSEAIDIALRSLINPGDEVIVMNPSYVAYTPGVALSGGISVPVELRHEDDFKLTPEALENAISDKTKVLLINFPSNPTGGVMSHADYEKLVPIIKKHHLIVLSDEIYAELTYDGTFASLAQFDEIKDQVIVINGFSKAFAMTGWRLGYILANKTLIQAMNKIHQYVIMSAPTAAQYGAIEGLKNGLCHVDEMVAAYRSRRNFIVSGFNRIGLQCHMPHGAFYVFPDIRATGLSSDAFCELLVKEEKVACVPGTAFGDAGEGFIRVSYAYSIDHIREALHRMEHFLQKFDLQK
ncbi:aminotransferase class I/II-fold pyridoxal phosphate-dependent enzyme [Merdibacter massiliensis]|uniref:aminotransferase class I/II-fold pyridoxal phosphate-dependent enzyme n=1 Tax=Merdibacter massiliensis TaxID=1871030 RepID=UPI00096A3652|nr:aminotransferase class I/II-fold pyridoxal phosphate-dependent enzyme [Merdibacter massiliensis]